MKTHRLAHRKCRGFTLIELMVTVTILAIFAAIGVPALLNGMDERRVRGAAENIMAQLRYAQSQSFKTNQKITFTPITGPSWSINIALKNEDNANDVINIDGANYKNTSLVASSGTLAFDPKRGDFQINNATLATKTTIFKVSKGSINMGITNDATSQMHFCSDNGLGGYPACP